MSEWVDYDAILSHSEADLYLIQGARGCGKTFNARRAAIKRYDKAKERGQDAKFCALTRHKTDKDTIEQDYFTKIQQEGYLTEWVFSWENHRCYRRRADSDKAPWEHIGYCVALSEQRVAKESTFVGMLHGTIIFDEIGLDRRDTSHRYLKDEYSFFFLSCLSSLLREKPGEATCKILMLSNAVDLTCPYYDALGLDYHQLTTHGKYWCLDKSALFVNLPNAPGWKEHEQNTIVGRLAKGTTAAKMIFDNAFESDTPEFIAQKPAKASYMCAISFTGQVYGIWTHQNVFYITPKAPKGQGTTYAITLQDNRIDYQAVRKADNIINVIISRHYMGMVRYHDAKIKESFISFLRFVGVV